MLWMEKKWIQTEKKGIHLPRLIVCDDFSVGSEALDKVHDFLVDTYHLKIGKAWEYDS